MLVSDTKKSIIQLKPIQILLLAPSVPSNFVCNSKPLLQDIPTVPFEEIQINPFDIFDYTIRITRSRPVIGKDF